MQSETSERLLKPEEVYLCSECTEVATHSVTDCRETAEGWQETEPRFGCNNHKVISHTYFLNGDIIATEEAIKRFEAV